MRGILLLAPILFNLGGLIDTYLTQLFGKGQDSGQLHHSTGTLMMIGSMVIGLFTLVVGIINYSDIFDLSTRSVGYLICSGLLFGLAARPYFEALKRETIENIVPIFQTIPIFSYIIARSILGENLSLLSIGLMIAIVIVTSLFSRNTKTKNINTQTLGLLLLASIMYSGSYVLFKLGGGEETNIWVAYFREHLGITLSCFPFLFFPKILSSTRTYITRHGIGFSLLNIANEFLFIAGTLIINYMMLIRPVAFVNTISNGLQPVLGFIMVYIAYRLLPSIFRREYSKKETIWKMSLCLVSFVLIYLFYQI